MAVIGDSTFLHTGVNSLMNMVYNQATGTVLILDNSTTGMTGHQDHAATGKTLQGKPTYAIDIPGLCKAIGVANVQVINAFDIEALEKPFGRRRRKMRSLSLLHGRRAYFWINLRSRCIWLIQTNVRNVVCV